MASPASISQQHEQDDEEWMFPLLLSFMAGASTCVGAAIVFCFDAKQIEGSMTFSLSLAASVMITVSVISIGPECLENIFVWQGAHLTFDVWLLVERLLSCGAGCFGYWLLSKALAAFPEPESFFVKSPATPLENTASTSYANHTTPRHSDMVDDEEVPETTSLIRRSTSGESTSSNASGRNTPQQKDKSSTSSSSKNPRSSPPSSRMRRTPSKTPMDTSVEDIDSGDKYESKRTKEEAASKKRSWRVAMLLFFSLLFHNFPEGLAVVASTVESRQLGVTVAIGILIHNIPEGIAIAVPCIAARPDMPWLAFWLASGSGLAEPLGAVFALFFLKSSKIPMENVLSCVAGIMCTVAFVELYPEALRHVPSESYSGSSNEPSSSSSPTTTTRKDYSQLIYGTLVGMAIMIATEWYLP
ncbi:unnamed protein product [Cylindrotheca closterium]|uniref:Uncharacterized protein n=1 Tax=Cylindrotheca closterium TaxID=2856 RepID=A0AAD2PVK5_9STRA|nr:unnamed protein product [Cylindrotheca closterium]